MSLEIKYNQVVIGSSLEAVLCAFYNKCKIIFTRNLIPDENDIIEDYGLGTSRREIWKAHILQLSLSGYVPFQDSISHISYIDSDTFKVVTRQETIIHLKFKEAYIFDDYNIFDLPNDLKKSSENIRMVDNFRVLDGNIKDIEPIQNKGRFINQVIPKQNTVSVISYIKKSDIDNYEHFLVKIKTENLLSSDSNIVELEHISREIYDLEKNIYEDYENLIFSYADEKTMYEIRKKRPKIDYMKYIRMKLGIADD